MPSKPPLGPPRGYYAVPDPDGTGKTTFWQYDGRTLTPWPTGAKYGPPRKPPYDPDLDPELRRTLNAAYRDAARDYVARTFEAIRTDPRTAAQAFVRINGRCRSCRNTLTADDLEPDTPPTSAQVAAERILAAALRGDVNDIEPMLSGADPADLVVQLSAVIAGVAALARAR